jgi:hypothetical protein
MGTIGKKLKKNMKPGTKLEKAKEWEECKKLQLGIKSKKNMR